jgi:hypothetical protein
MKLTIGISGHFYAESLKKDIGQSMLITHLIKFILSHI